MGVRGSTPRSAGAHAASNVKISAEKVFSAPRDLRIGVLLGLILVSAWGVLFLLYQIIKQQGRFCCSGLVGEVGRNIEELSTGRRDCLREHGVTALDAHLLVPAGANEMGQPLGVVGIGLVGPRIERALGSPSVKAYHRQPTFTQFRPEPGGQRPGIEADPTAPGACLQMAVSSSSGWLAHLPRQTRPRFVRT